MTDLDIPESGAVFTFGKSRFAENKPSHFFIKNDPVIHIACGDEHTAVICQNGRVFAFGSNEWGQLGLGHNNMVHKPSCIKALKPEKAKYLACGRAHTLILTESNSLYSCGSNTDGQLGLENVEMVSTPTKINEAPFDFEKIIKLSAGSQHSVALTDEGKVFVWGSNSEGQLGFESSRSNLKIPTKLEFTDKVIDISCGYYHTALVTESGELFMFGENENGKLGIPTSDNHYRPTKVVIPSSLRSISCGGSHSVGIDVEGNAIVFGSNQQNEIGLPKNIQWATEPIKLAPEIFKNEKIKIVSCGENHTAFITESDKLYTCGDNRHGKLCQDETEDQNMEGPQPVGKFENYFVTNIACGGCHTILSAQKTEEEFKRTTNLPPLQRIPTSQSLHGIKADSMESTNENVDRVNGENSEKIEESIKSDQNSNNDSNIKNSEILENIKSPISAFTTEISDGIEEISTSITKKQDDIKNSIETSVHTMENKISEIKDNSVHTIENKITEIKDGLDKNLTSLTSKTESFMGNLKEKVENSTQNKIDNFVKEAKDKTSSEIDKFASMTGVKSFLGPKTDSIENLLDELNDDEDEKSSNEDAVSIASEKKDPEKPVEQLIEKPTLAQKIAEKILPPNDDELPEVRPPFPMVKKRIPGFLSTFRRKRIVATAFNFKKIEDGEKVKDANGEENGQTQACSIL